MCNEAARRMSLDQLRCDGGETRSPPRFPKAPNLALLEGLRIDPTVIIRAEGAVPVMRRWNGPGAHGEPVYNFRAAELRRPLPAGSLTVDAVT